MSIRRGLFNRTSGVPMPLTIPLNGKRFHLREFVIQIALVSEDRELTDEEESKIIEVMKALKHAFPNCWKQPLGSDHCLGILRAVRTLLNLLNKPDQRSRKQEVEDLKRWLDYGKAL